MREYPLAAPHASRFGRNAGANATAPSAFCALGVLSMTLQLSRLGQGFSNVTALRISPIKGIALPLCVLGLSVSSSSDPIVGQDHLPGAGNYWVAIGVPATGCQPVRHPTPDGNERIQKCCRRLSGPTPIQARSHRTESARGSPLAQLMVRGARRGGPAFLGGPVGRLTLESG